jgi:hypothetical protein
MLENQHEFGPINDTMRLLQTCQKRNKILIREGLYIQEYHAQGKLIKEQIPHERNILFTLGKVAILQDTLIPSNSRGNT